MYLLWCAPGRKDAAADDILSIPAPIILYFYIYSQHHYSSPNLLCLATLIESANIMSGSYIYEAIFQILEHFYEAKFI